jgi:hypothetical protein
MSLSTLKCLHLGDANAAPITNTRHANRKFIRNAMKNDKSIHEDRIKWKWRALMTLGRSAKSKSIA